MKNGYITLHEIPHSQQRYPTAGDWQELKSEDGVEALAITSSQLSDPRFTLNVQIHEILEALLCKHAGITQQRVDDWDMAYEQERTIIIATSPGNGHAGVLPCGCVITETSDPGDDTHAPYHAQHEAASLCEMIVGAHLKIDWAKYVKEIEEL